jgi:6-phosphogluconolactonase
LGLGEDGHTASIFPHQMELLKANALCAVATHPNSGQKRISFTGEMINNAKHIAFLATGNKKAEMVREIILDKNKSLPATHNEATNGKLTWLLDSESAKLL